MREYLLILLLSAGTTYLLATVAREAAVRVGAVAQVRDRDVHATPIPYLGGIAILGGIAAAVLMARQLPFLGSSQAQVNHDALAVLIGGAVICAVGVIDDLVELDAVTKLVGQLVAAGVVVVQGIQFYWLPVAQDQTFALDGSQAALLTIFLIVATVNAVNFVDGLDGLAAGVVGIGAVAFFSFAIVLAVENHVTRVSTAAVLTAALSGACLGFLPHNFFPARMFMGDSGSMLIGFVLACSAVSLTGQFAPAALSAGVGSASASLLPALLPLVLPVAVLVVPFVDLVLAVVRRTRAGRSPFSPDKQHLHHRLLEIGHSHRRAVLVMYLWAGLVAFGVVVVSLATGGLAFLGVGLLLLFAVVATFGLPGRRRGLL
jgi:UDP-GlcNAc:undecaprenyl-phosphate/decaprenyl-phosphate GlcNAc-1-phosphate transferase